MRPFLLTHRHLARRAGVPAAAALLGALIATPALADVTVSPATAPQGEGENLTFHVTNTGTQPIHTITLRLPADTPVAEVYPLSVDNWAPKIEMKDLSTPLPTIHGDTKATETAASITWLAMPGKDLAPGKGTDVRVAIGPLPTLSSMRFTVATTYADGKAGPAMPPADLKLTPGTGGAPAGHNAHGGSTATTGTSDAEAQYFAQTVADAERGTSLWAIGGWVVAGLVLLGGAVVMFRGRHRAAEDDDEPDEEETKAEDQKEPVTAGSGKWAYKG
ncbi:hypothetical protein Ade02nite_36030 [Paractinoplanes deccanensis]|uniref:YncI copper-binding domain-containing protein n=1 Tax=Paractinoplanes deccanensis TaxID=113561 RepID=A0ABQ3Y4R5_9ACTN|nr:DUF1775 domain-containing protein [Actinoplanes deccanensis]GID74962.1 hypothetical protein Ade02nite_36030 [Actinoplanes deccanensis]